MESDPKIVSLAEQVHKRGFAVPAIFFLEMYKPLSSLAHAAALVSSPFLVALFGSERYQAALRVLADREQLEALIRKIEQFEQEPNGVADGN